MCLQGRDLLRKYSYQKPEFRCGFPTDAPNGGGKRKWGINALPEPWILHYRTEHRRLHRDQWLEVTCRRIRSDLQPAHQIDFHQTILRICRRRISFSQQPLRCTMVWANRRWTHTHWDSPMPDSQWRHTSHLPNSKHITCSSQDVPHMTHSITRGCQPTDMASLRRWVQWHRRLEISQHSLLVWAYQCRRCSTQLINLWVTAKCTRSATLPKFTSTTGERRLILVNIFNFKYQSFSFIPVPVHIIISFLLVFMSRLSSLLFSLAINFWVSLAFLWFKSQWLHLCIFFSRNCFHFIRALIFLWAFYIVFPRGSPFSWAVTYSLFKHYFVDQRLLTPLSNKWSI